LGLGLVRKTGDSQFRARDLWAPIKKIIVSA
jgi:hypothetical protein